MKDWKDISGKARKGGSSKKELKLITGDLYKTCNELWEKYTTRIINKK